MEIIFTKYHANGNDFILVMDHDFPKKFRQKNIISRLCHRRTGVGADGLFIIFPSTKFDFTLDYYNSDGSGETLCANGSRCAAHFMQKQPPLKSNLVFRAGDGTHTSKIKENNNVFLSMRKPKYKSDKVSLEGVTGFFVDSGARHFVCESENMDDDYVFSVGRKIRYSKMFMPRGINVNFYKKLANGNIEIKTYEKGVEKVMLSCASGSTAVVFHLSKLRVVVSPVTTFSSGGSLTFIFDKRWENAWLQGSVEFLFSGKFDAGVLL